MNKMKEIRYPNTVKWGQQESYTIGRNCDEIDYGSKFIAIYQNDKLIAEIGTNVCNIYYEQD